MSTQNLFAFTLLPQHIGCCKHFAKHNMRQLDVDVLVMKSKKGKKYIPKE
jgi:hypothetical protein